MAKDGKKHLEKAAIETLAVHAGEGADPTTPLPTCDQCGRIVYWEA